MVIGGGIWAVELVARLVLDLLTAVCCAPVYALALALIAILSSGAPLLSLRFVGDGFASGVVFGADGAAVHSQAGLGDKVARLGSRLITGTAGKLSATFFDSFADAVAEREAA